LFLPPASTTSSFPNYYDGKFPSAVSIKDENETALLLQALILLGGSGSVSPVATMKQ
jgi:hypothetical protein